MTAEVIDLPLRPQGRPSNAWLGDRVERLGRLLDGLRLEIRILNREHRAFAAEVRATCRRIEVACMADRPDIVLHFNAQLLLLAERHERRGGDEAA